MNKTLLAYNSIYKESTYKETTNDNLYQQRFIVTPLYTRSCRILQYYYFDIILNILKMFQNCTTSMNDVDFKS